MIKLFPFLATIHFCLFVFVLPAVSSAKPNLIILRNNLESIELVTQSLLRELKNDFSFIEIEVTDKTTPKNIEKTISNGDPVAILILSNKAIKVYHEYQQSQSNRQFAPAIVLMALGIDIFVEKLINATGIYYDIPIVSVVYSLRDILKVDKLNLGIIYRKNMAGMIEKNIDLCKKENVNLATLKLPNSATELKKVLPKQFKQFIKSEPIDFLIIPSDNYLLTPEFINTLYKPVSRKNNIAVIVGIETLSSKSADFAAISIVPDYDNLGIQAAELLRDIQENNWNIPENKVSETISKFEIINVTSQNKFLLEKGAEKRADKVVK